MHKLNILSHILCLLLLAIVLSACSDQLDADRHVIPDSDCTITLHLKASELTRSSESDKSENVIKSLYVGFYPATASENEPATAWLPVEFTNSVEERATVALKLTPQLISSLFNNTDGATCKFYVLANATNVPENSSIEDMKSYEIVSPFDTQDVQDSFLMSSSGVVTYQKNSSKASGNGDLTRVAAKINLNLQIPSRIVINEDSETEKEVWTLAADKDIRVRINNGVKSAKVDPSGVLGDLGGLGGLGGGDLDELGGLGDMSDPEPSLTSDFYSGAERVISKIGEGDYPYIMDVPFYTYPNEWDEFNPETVKTTLTLVIPWHKEGDQANQSTDYYYQVPVTDEDVTSIDSNNHYIINLKVDMLGSVFNEETSEIEASYVIVPWGDAQVGVDLNNIRFLDVNPKEYTFNNTSTLSIPFYTSHPAEISDITMYYQRFNYPNNNTGGVIDIAINKEQIDRSTTTSSLSATKQICEYDIVRDPVSKMMTIQIKHPMIVWNPVEKNGSSVSLTQSGTLDDLDQKKKAIYKYVFPETDIQKAYYPYKFEVTVRHIDDHSYSESVVIYQYPGMYIVDDKCDPGKYFALNTDYALTEPPSLVDYGYVFINSEAFLYDGKTAWKNPSANFYSNPFTDVNNHPTTREYVDGYLSSLLGGMRPWVEPSGNEENVNNYNMYVINMTQLSASDVDSYGNRYVIGDPRSHFINNELYGETLTEDNTEASSVWCHAAKALYNNQEKRTLRYYYPTDETDVTKMMVAPRLRISSSYGFVRSQEQLCDKSVVRRRAATYQERGFPAGRWRLPTYGELSFICRLSAQKKIPTLFKTGYRYMTAQGVFLINDDGIPVAPENASEDIYLPNPEWTGSEWSISGQRGCNVRPVYDEWYWDEIDQGSISDGNGGYIYTLGDMPIKRN